MRRFIFLMSLATIGALICAGAWSDEPPKGKGGERSMRRQEWGKLADGTPVELFELTNANGMKAKITNYGGIVTELHVPDRNGNLADVVLGFDNLNAYLAGHPYFGCITGRVANRIAKGKFTLDGKEYTLATNNGPNALHGGKRGFDKVVWKASERPVPEGVGLQLVHTSPDGDEGYPGNLQVTVTYVLSDQNELKIAYHATSDKPTPVNLTNHSYFNLAGAGSGDVLGHELMLAADKYTPVNESLIPTGELKAVQGSVLDFTKPAKIGARIGELKGDPGGYDHNYVLNGPAQGSKLAARAHEPKSGRTLEMYTTEPGVQLYTGNYLDGTPKGKGGAAYQKHAGFCLEAQHFPDSVNQPMFPSIILRPGMPYFQLTTYRFSAK